MQTRLPKPALLLLFMVMILCMGCPYESKFPLDGTRVKYDKNLIGSWHQEETDLKIIRVDDYRFSYVFTDHDETNGDEEETGTGYAVANNGATYLVADRDKEGSVIFAVYKVLSIESGSLIVIPLEEDQVPAARKFTSSKEFTSYVISNPGAFAYANKAEFEKGASSYAGYKPPARNKDNPVYSNSSDNGAVLFREDFQTDANNWYSNYDFKDSNYIYIATLDNPDNHYYLFRNRKYNNGYMVPVPYYSIPSANYSVEVSTKHFDGVDNSGYGIKFAASGWKNCYNFNISADGYYRISKRQDDVYSDLVPWTTSDALYKGATMNRLQVRVYSSYTEFYINGQLVKRLDLTPFGSTAGLEVYNNQTVYFDDLIVRSLSGSAKPPTNVASSGVLFREDFQTSDNNWYSNYNFKDSNYIYISTLDNPDNHYYLFRNRKANDGFIVPIPYYSIPDEGYSIEITARHFDGTNEYGYGLKFAGKDWDNCYSLNITNNGYYRVSKKENGRYSAVVDWTTSSALNQGSSGNKLEVRVYASYADIYINDQYITRISDFRRMGNTAGLEVYNNQTVYFDDLVIRQL